MSQWEDLKIERRATKLYELIFKKDGIAYPITGWTIYFTVKKNAKDEDVDAVIDKKITDHESPLEGKTLITLSPTDTDLEGSYYYSIDYKDDDGNENVLFEGRVKFDSTLRKERN